ncbi:Flagellar hook-associated protein flgK (plasmid) [Rhodovastum atsumiense]|uniref:flagellar hook-associated protein FlgK n=1 Tax=Rhodovastum atsumiense TaxID=504468 RepID=UPI0020254A58|nr:flagellar hook-associated protein FlgK [Rhodovastum atsumiense]CAH2605523.1 Flagellar hook-associated protein flgK [Rhodovastum atsumiense]
MTISGALANALSSLQIEQRQAELIAGNIANANTPGYVRRGLPRAEQITGTQGTGVEPGTLVRLGDATLEAAANQTAGAQAYSQRMIDVLGAYMKTVGQPADSQSLPSTLSAFQKSLAALSSNPDNTVAQQAAVSAAQDLVDTLHGLDTAVADARVQADQGLNADVTAVNTALTQLSENEVDLKRAASRGETTAPFEDTRASLIAEIAQRVPVKVFQDSNNSIIITTDRGTTLWDGQVHKLSFTPTSALPAGQVGDTIKVDGRVLNASESGSIAAGLTLRDTTLPKFSQQLDAIAGNLVLAFQQKETNTNAAGVFIVNSSTIAGVHNGIGDDHSLVLTTDATYTTPFDVTDSSAITGLASAITLNSRLDPSQSNGEVWRIRDGAQATSEGYSSDNSKILSFIQALNGQGSYDSSVTDLPNGLNLSNATSQVAGLQQSELATWTSRNETRTSQAQEAQTTLKNQSGVNIDEELQRLLLVQQTHSASAQVIQAAARMLDELNKLQ